MSAGAIGSEPQTHRTAVAQIMKICNITRSPLYQVKQHKNSTMFLCIFMAHSVHSKQQNKK